MKTRLLALIALVGVSGIVYAAPQKFDFKDPKSGNSVAFKLVAPKETIEGSANDISGTITFDPANPAATSGKIVTASKSLNVPNGMMRQHMHGAMWLDANKYPEIVFEVKQLKNVKVDGDKTTAEAVGNFTLKGVTKEVSAPVTLTYLKGKLSDRMPGHKGDLLVVRATFTIQRSDFNVNAHQNEEKVADKIDLTFGAAGASEEGAGK